MASEISAVVNLLHPLFGRKMREAPTFDAQFSPAGGNNYPRSAHDVAGIAITAEIHAHGAQSPLGTLLAPSVALLRKSFLTCLTP